MNRSWMSGIGSSGLLLTNPVIPPGSSVAKPLPRNEPLPQRQQQSVGPHVAHQRAFVAAAVDQQRGNVVLQVLADAWQPRLHRDTVLSQFIRVADARQHQQLRRIDRAAARG